ncbi:MAG: phosphate ABC transporter substrate-binding protein [Clostridia bacterium]|nr:phosphate ABC transporter substrate-binding protein [Clostridia bacterium]
MRKTISVVLSIVLFICLLGCKNNKNVSTDGSTSMELIIGALGEAYEMKTGITVTYNPTGSSAGIKAVSEGRCDIGLASRKLKKEEIENGLKETVLALDGIVIIVNHKNPVGNLKMSQISAIFKGEIRNWEQLGGDKGEIILIGREAGSGTRDGFETATDTLHKAKYRQELTSSGDVITTVSKNAFAIGYTSLSSVKNNVKTLRIDNVIPSEETIKNGNYKVQRPFIAVTNENKPLLENSRNFFEFITSEEAEDIIRFAGVFPAG